MLGKHRSKKSARPDPADQDRELYGEEPVAGDHRQLEQYARIIVADSTIATKRKRKRYQAHGSDKRWWRHRLQ